MYLYFQYVLYTNFLCLPPCPIAIELTNFLFNDPLKSQSNVYFFNMIRTFRGQVADARPQFFIYVVNFRLLNNSAYFSRINVVYHAFWKSILDTYILKKFAVFIRKI